MQDMMRAIHEEWTGSAEDGIQKIRRRVAFHCGRKTAEWITSDVTGADLRHVVYAVCAPKCKAYERRCAEKLGTMADSLGVPKKGFWTKDELRTAVRVRAYSNLESAADVEWIRTTYDRVLTDLNESDHTDAPALARLYTFMHPDRFLCSLGPSPEFVRKACSSSPFAARTLERIEKGSRMYDDLGIVRRHVLLSQLSSG